MLTASYGWAQPIVRRLCELDQRNIRFCLEPDRATLHFVALCIRGWTRRSAGVGEIEWLATRLARQGRRLLIGEIWGRDLGSPRLLSRCRGGVWPAARYDQLAALLADQPRRAALARLARVRSKDVAVLAATPAALLRGPAMDVVFRHGLSATSYVLAGIRRRGPLISEPDVLGRLSRVKSFHDFAQAIHDALLDVPFPEPPWPGSATLRPLRTLREVHAVGEQFQNCLSDPSQALVALAGEMAIYVGEPRTGRVCASLVHDRALGSWRLGEIKGVRNARLSPAAAKSICRAFEWAGFPYLPNGPLGISCRN